MRPYYFLGENRGLTQLATGEFFYVNTEDRSITPWILHGGYWEIFVDDILCALARPGDVFIDVGANMGYYTIKIGKRIGPEGHVYSFEPNPDTFEFLRDNIMINAFESRSTLFKAAVGDQPGEAFLSFQRREPGGGAVHADRRNDDNEVAVPVLRLDDAIPADRPVSLIKIDVEGFEPAVLAGMTGLLARNPDAVVVLEMAAPQWARFGDPFALLTEAAGGRDIYRIHHDGHIKALPKHDPTSALEVDFVSYLLLLPPTAERQKQVARFILPEGGQNSAKPISPQLSRSHRLRARLKALLGGH